MPPRAFSGKISVRMLAYVRDLLLVARRPAPPPRPSSSRSPSPAPASMTTLSMRKSLPSSLHISHSVNTVLPGSSVNSSARGGRPMRRAAEAASSEPGASSRSARAARAHGLREVGLQSGRSEPDPGTGRRASALHAGALPGSAAPRRGRKEAAVRRARGRRQAARPRAA